MKLYLGDNQGYSFRDITYAINFCCFEYLTSLDYKTVNGINNYVAAKFNKPLYRSKLVFSLYRANVSVTYDLDVEI